MSAEFLNSTQTTSYAMNPSTTKYKRVLEIADNGTTSDIS